MVKCSFCGKKIGSLPFKCKFCGLYYCEDCRLPEFHNCVGLDIYNIEHEIKFQEQASFVVNNYAKADDRGYTVIVQKPDPESNRGKINSSTSIPERKVSSTKSGRHKKKISSPHSTSGNKAANNEKGFAISDKTTKPIVTASFKNQSENKENKLKSSRTKHTKPNNPTSTPKNKSKHEKYKSNKSKSSIRKPNGQGTGSRPNSKAQSPKNATLYLSLLCIAILGTLFFMNSYEPDDTGPLKDNLGNFLDDGISKKEIPIVKASGESVQLVNYKNATDPTWDGLISFLRNDPTDGSTYNGSFVCADFAEMLHNNAEKAGLKAGYVSVDFLDMESHALNVFSTTDKGLVFVDCTGDTEKLGALDSKDKIAYVQIGKEYGIVSAYKTDSPDYEFYEIHKRKRSQGVPGVYFDPLGIVKDFEIYW